MSRKITKQSIAAFLTDTEFKSGNTEVRVYGNVTTLRLFGNEIAFRGGNKNHTLSITNCGYKTNTTKERLNGLPGVTINQKSGVWFLNGKEWDGKLINII